LEVNRTQIGVAGNNRLIVREIHGNGSDLRRLLWRGKHPEKYEITFGKGDDVHETGARTSWKPRRSKHGRKK